MQTHWQRLPVEDDHCEATISQLSFLLDCFGCVFLKTDALQIWLIGSGQMGGVGIGNWPEGTELCRFRSPLRAIAVLASKRYG